MSRQHSSRFVLRPSYLFSTIAAGLMACAPMTPEPGGNWILITTVQQTITEFGSRLTYGSWSIDGVLQQAFLPTVGDRTTFFDVFSGGDGKYYAVNAVTPGEWAWNYNNGPCEGMTDVETFYNNQPYDLVCTVTVNESMSIMGFLEDGTPVYTGGNDKLFPGLNHELWPGNCRVSADSETQLCYQGDGNLVLYDNGSPVWASNTGGTSPGVAAMQGDGNFVVYDSSWNPVWSTGTAGYDEASIVVLSFGCATMYSSDATVEPWSTGGCQY